MSLILDENYLNQNYSGDIANISEGLFQQTPAERRTVAAGKLALYTNEILKNIKGAVEEEVNLCTITLPHNGIPYNFKWEELLKRIFWTLLKVKIHDTPDFLKDKRFQHNPILSADLKLTWKFQQSKAIKSLLGLRSNPADSFEESQKLNEFRKKAPHKYCDFTFTVKDKKFPVHKVILAKSSNFFEPMFGSGFQEGVGNDPVRFGPDYLQPKMFEELLEYIYTGNTELDSKEVVYIIDFAALAHMTEIHSLVEICHSHLRQSIKNDTFYYIARHAAILEEQQLLAACKNFVTQNPNAANSIDLSQMTPQELINCYNMARLLESENLMKRALAQVNSNMNKDTFHEFCKGAANAKSEELKKGIKKACYKFATENKALLQTEEMSASRDTYTKLMTGL
jgi:hypothetical protein